MKRTKKTPYYLLIGGIFCLLYILFAIPSLGTEYQFIPEWHIDVTNPTVKELKETDKLLHFKLGKTMGYFTEEGKVTNFTPFSYKASISQSFYTSYDANNTGTAFYTPDGKKVGVIKEAGYPMIDDDRIYVFLPGGASFVKCKENGETEWEYGGTVPITAFDSSEGGCIAGFADGSICEFTPTGSVMQNFAPGGSEYPVILGISLSSTGEYIASVSGQEKQRFVLAKKDGAQTKIIYHEFISSDEPLQKLVKFSKDDSTVYFNAKDMLGVINTKTLECRHIPIKGQALSLHESGKSIFVLTKLKDTYTVYIIEKFATLTGSFSFKAKTAFIETEGDKLYVGKDSTISKLTIAKK